MPAGPALSAGHLGAPRDPAFGHYDPPLGACCTTGEQARRHESATRACGARLHGNHRGEAPQGAPARVMGRQSLPLKGLARPQGGHGVRRSAPALCGASPSSIAFEADRTDGGRVPSISRSADACPPGCLKSESVVDAHATTRAVSPARCDARVHRPGGVTRALDAGVHEVPQRGSLLRVGLAAPAHGLPGHGAIAPARQ